MIDIFKGAAILSVIFIHAAFCTGQSYRPLNASMMGIGQVGLFFDAPLFFFLSGWGATLAQNNIKRIILRLTKLYVQYAIMVTFLALCILLLFNEHTTPYDVSRWLVLKNLHTISLPVVMASMWFFVTYFMVYLTTPLLLKIYKNNRLSIFLIFILIIINAIFTFHEMSIGKIVIYSNMNIMQFLYYLLFYFMGIYLCDTRITTKSFAIMFTVLLFMFVLCLYKFNFDFNLQINKFPPTTYYLIASLFSILIVLSAKNMENRASELIKNDPIIKFLGYSGKNVFSIYLYQGFGSSLPTLALPYLLSVTGDWRILLSLNFITIILITYPLAGAFKLINDCVLNNCFMLANNFSKRRR